MSSFMTDTTASPGTATLLRFVESCLALTGDDDWTVPFTTLAEATGAVQLMVFSYATARADCLLSRNFREDAVGSRLAERYLKGWYREDPLLQSVLTAPAPSLEVIDRPDLTGDMPDRYRAEFFTDSALRGKTAVLAVGRRLRLIVNLYWPADPGPRPDHTSDLCPLLGRLALLHFESRPEHALPAPLAVLSDRERAVCRGILAGKKAEQIAGTLDIAPSSVATYRARAYQKLGISSRGALFALCGGGVGQR